MNTATIVEPNLVSRISEILAAHHHPNPTGWEAGLHPDALSHPEESVRRYQINKYWRKALSPIDISGEGNTIAERFCLIEDGTTEDWLRLFDHTVVRCIIKYQIGFPLH